MTSVILNLWSVVLGLYQWFRLGQIMYVTYTVMQLLGNFEYVFFFHVGPRYNRVQYYKVLTSNH